MLKITNEKNVQELAKMFYTAKSVSSSQVTREEDGFSYQTMSPSWTSNENSSYMHRIITTGSNVLAVAGSFDHIIDMAMYGARNIYAVDVNPLQFPVDWLKYQAVMSLTAGQFKKFALNTRADMLSNELMSIILERTEDSVEKEFWEKVYSEKTPMNIRMDYLMNERSYVINRSERVVKFDYPEYSLWNRARKALEEAEIYEEEKDILEVQLPEKSMDVIHLSNIHNFYRPAEFALKVRNISKFLKQDGSIVLYCIGMKPEWFEAVRNGSDRLPLYQTDFNMAVCAKNPLLMKGLQQQISFTMLLYQELLNDFEVEVIPVRTGKGFVGYNTTTDVVLAARHK